MLKLKAGKASLDPKRLKAFADRDPTKVFELDYIGMMPEMYERAISSATKLASVYGRKSVEEELRKQIERDTETLRLFRDYPSTSSRTQEARAIAARLQLAAARVYGDDYAHKLLKRLYWDYYPRTDYLVVPGSLYNLDRRYAAERESASERDRRIAAERARDESENSRKAAQLAQEQADRKVAESMVREDENMLHRAEMQRREDELRKQFKITEQAALTAAHARDLEERQQQESPAPAGVDPELWAMGAGSRPESQPRPDFLDKDNIE